MKMYRIAVPLPMEYIPIEEGGNKVDYAMHDEDVADFEEKYDFQDTLGEGSFGVAYDIGDDKVMKFTTDKQEYEAADTLHEAPWVANSPFATIHDLGEYGTYYYIIKEKVVPLTEDQADVFYTYAGEYYADIEKMEEGSAEYYKANEELLIKFDEYATDIQNYTGFTDVFNTGNIGFDPEGRVVCFDARLKEW